MGCKYEAAYNHQRILRAAQDRLPKPERWDGRRSVAEQRGSNSVRAEARPPSWAPTHGAVTSNVMAGLVRSPVATLTR